MLDKTCRAAHHHRFRARIGNEYHSTGINPFFSHERLPGGPPDRAGLDESLAVRFEGEHYNLRY